MAQRPIFIPSSTHLFEEKNVEFTWVPGMAMVQKQKNIQALHEAGKKAEIHSILEVSSKSANPLGVQLSAFNLTLTVNTVPRTIENIFQSSKVFEKAGPFEDLLYTTPREAKQDERLSTSGGLIGFRWLGIDYPREPKTIFYDWIYISALLEHKTLSQTIMQYEGFTDIEFNPEKSINCQARATAVFVSLNRQGFFHQPFSFSRFRDAVLSINEDYSKPQQDSLF